MNKIQMSPQWWKKKEAKNAETVAKLEADIEGKNKTIQSLRAKLEKSKEQPAVDPAVTEKAKVMAEYRKIDIEEKGGVEKRKSFRRMHREIFGGMA